MAIEGESCRLSAICRLMHPPRDMDIGTASQRPKTQRQTASGGVCKTAADEFHRRALGAPSFFECHRVEILTVAPDLSFPNIPYMGVWKISAFVCCAVNAGKTAQRDDS